MEDKSRQIKNETLISTISQYIEENYEGYSYREAYHFDEASAATLGPIQKAAPEPSVLPLLEDDDRNSNEDPFDDILGILVKTERKTTPSQSVKEYDAIQDLLNERTHAETFTEYMLRIIAEKGLCETEVYHSVFMDRKLFNKIRNDANYQPSKRTALLIAIALKLSVQEAQELLGKAGFALTHCSKTDLIIECCLLHGIYDIFEINEMLDAFGQQTLNKVQ